MSPEPPLFNKTVLKQYLWIALILAPLCVSLGTMYSPFNVETTSPTTNTHENITSTNSTSINTPTPIINNDTTFRFISAVEPYSIQTTQKIILREYTVVQSYMSHNIDYISMYSLWTISDPRPYQYEGSIDIEWTTAPDILHLYYNGQYLNSSVDDRIEFALIPANYSVIELGIVQTIPDFPLTCYLTFHYTIFYNSIDTIQSTYRTKIANFSLFEIQSSAASLSMILNSPDLCDYMRTICIPQSTSYTHSCTSPYIAIGYFNVDLIDDYTQTVISSYTVMGDTVWMNLNRSYDVYLGDEVVVTSPGLTGPLIYPAANMSSIHLPYCSPTYFNILSEPYLVDDSARFGLQSLAYYQTNYTESDFNTWIDSGADPQIWAENTSLQTYGKNGYWQYWLNETIAVPIGQDYYLKELVIYDAYLGYKVFFQLDTATQDYLKIPAGATVDIWLDGNAHSCVVQYQDHTVIYTALN